MANTLCFTGRIVLVMMEHLYVLSEAKTALKVECKLS